MSLFQNDKALQIVGDVERLALKPGDKIVITCPGRISPEISELLTRHFAARFEGHEIIVLGDGAKLSVLEPSPEPQNPPEA